MSNHEEHTLMRRFDHNKDGQISMEEFYNTLAQSQAYWAEWQLEFTSYQAENLWAAERYTIKLRSLRKLQLQNQS